MSNPKVSVCIPIYNGMAHLAEAIESALAQTYADLEILLVDDCSDDESVALARRLAEDDCRVRCFRNPQNLGLVGNWNRCIELARGQWIKFLFQDDVLAPTCIERLLERAEQGWGFVACDREFIFDSSVSEQVQGWYRESRETINGFLAASSGANAESYAREALKGLHKNIVGEPTVTLIRADVLREFGPFNDELVQLCDVEYWLRLGVNIGVGYVAEPLALFRVHGRAISAENRAAKNFMATGLDKLLLAHTAAYSPDCIPLRNVAAALHPPMDLEQTFQKRAHEVRDWVRANGDKRCGEELVSEVYARFIREHLDCAPAPVPHFFWRLRAAAWRVMHTSYSRIRTP